MGGGGGVVVSGSTEFCTISSCQEAEVLCSNRIFNEKGMHSFDGNKMAIRKSLFWASYSTTLEQ